MSVLPSEPVLHSYGTSCGLRFEKESKLVSSTYHQALDMRQHCILCFDWEITVSFWFFREVMLASWVYLPIRPESWVSLVRHTRPKLERALPINNLATYAHSDYLAVSQAEFCKRQGAVQPGLAWASSSVLYSNDIISRPIYKCIEAYASACIAIIVNTCIYHWYGMFQLSESCMWCEW